MMETQNYWEDNSAHSMQVKYEGLDGRSCKDEIYRMGLGSGYCEGNLNFATASEDDEAYTKKKVSRQDPMSHRIIEKRRRDRMNNCLADLSRLIPAEYLKKGRGRVEKTEIIEMAIRHMKHLQGLRQDTKHSGVATVHPEDIVDSVSHPTTGGSSTGSEHYRLGFQECLSETMHFLVEVEGFFARDSLCVQLINHLQQHCDKILATSDRLGFPHPEMLPTNGTGNGNSYNHHHNHHHATIPGLCQPTTNGHSDHGSSSSGVSSFGDPERPLRPTLVPPPMIVSDDSNHSTHSHSTPPMMMMLNSFPSSINTTSSYNPQESTISNDNNNIENINTTTVSNDYRPTNYKFKSSIKQRFSAERIKSSPSPIINLHDKQSGNHGVPIFALHEAGTFYVPLTIEASLLRPHLNFMAESGPDTMLHPVTISVNFNHTSGNAPSWLPHDHPPHSPQNFQQQE